MLREGWPATDRPWSPIRKSRQGTYSVESRVSKVKLTLCENRDGSRWIFGYYEEGADSAKVQYDIWRFLNTRVKPKRNQQAPPKEATVMATFAGLVRLTDSMLRQRMLLALKSVANAFGLNVKMTVTLHIPKPKEKYL